MEDDDNTTPSEWTPEVGSCTAGTSAGGGGSATAGETSLSALLRAAIAAADHKDAGQSVQQAQAPPSGTAAHAPTCASNQPNSNSKKALSAEERAARDLREAGPSWAYTPFERSSIQGAYCERRVLSRALSSDDSEDSDTGHGSGPLKRRCIRK
ncbi:uncharacterized protein LOC123879985 [Maniola jurtina]|uniref:uncharacterized protein LOC123879985 n=1 Tax=Maniola jurtina TaxID=191418 RepID=UPI001E68A71B|nr:uncharacterized protein LOC123879985 [Maniola jurtina]